MSLRGFMHQSMNNNNSFELVCDILDGCVFECNDCYITKENDNKLTEEFYNVSYSFMQYYDPFAITIGHTDFFTATNTKSILRDIRLTELIRKFDRLVINSTLMKLDDDIIDQLCKLNIPIQINIVIPLNKFKNESYLQIVARNIAYIRKTLDIIVHPQINTPSDVVIDDYDHTTRVYERVIGTGVDFNPSFILSLELSNQEKAQYFKNIRKSIETSNIKNGWDMSDKHIDVTRTSDTMERPILYSNKKFYIVPTMYAHCNIISDDLQFVDFDSYSVVSNTLQARQLSFVYNNNAECSTCENIAVCATRNTIYVMEQLDTTSCLLPKDIILGYKWNSL